MTRLVAAVDLGHVAGTIVVRPVRGRVGLAGGPRRGRGRRDTDVTSSGGLDAVTIGQRWSGDRAMWSVQALTVGQLLPNQHQIPVSDSIPDSAIEGHVAKEDVEGGDQGGHGVGQGQFIAVLVDQEEGAGPCSRGQW